MFVQETVSAVLVISIILKGNSVQISNVIAGQKFLNVDISGMNEVKGRKRGFSVIKYESYTYQRRC